MTRPAIRVDGLWKEYQVGGPQRVHGTFYDFLAGALKAPLKRLRRLSGRAEPAERFWALQDLGFEVQPGEVLGIIGRNGAGKSTLLKILSRITAPTRGRVEVRGRLGSLLEVGTGFHPELSGRENIYLNGAILGMSRSEIGRKFDEIVAFAEVEQFLDTPVKRYSSGMYVRLAFAVAAHLDLEVMLVDEILAVGDVMFQKKCLSKMGETASVGKTVLFISHNMDSIRKLCNRGLVLCDGALVHDSPVDEAIDTYLSLQQDRQGGGAIELDVGSEGGFFVHRIEVLGSDGTVLEPLRTWDDVTFRIVFHSPRDMKQGSVSLQLSTLSGTVLTVCSTQPDSAFPVAFRMGFNSVDCRIPRLELSAGRYLLGVGLAVPYAEWLYKNFDAAVLEITEKDVFSSGLAPRNTRYSVPMEHFWSVSTTDSLSSQTVHRT